MTLSTFIFPTLPSTWFIGHMSRALREMQLMIQSQRVDLVIETRDARMPLTSLNPAFEQILDSAGGKGAGMAKRLIVYNKADLAQACFQEPLRKALLIHGQQEVIFTDSRSDEDVKRLLETAIRMANRELEGPDDRISMLVAGMPNVGKSSILNSLRRVGVRKGKAASTSSMPGHTRRLSTVIKISTHPPTYIYDTPGIMVPYLGRGIKGNEAALKLALTGGIKESLFEGDTISEYLLWRLKSRCESGEGGYSEAALLESLALPPSTSLTNPQEFLTALAIRLSARSKGGDPDVDFASRYLIRVFREGKFGRWTLDGLGRGGEVVDYEEMKKVIEAGGKVKEYYSTSIRPSTEIVQSIQPDPIDSIEGQMIDKEVDLAVASFYAVKESKTELSGNQMKKDKKAAQAKVRDVKRKSLAVVHVKGTGIASARRRNYRR